MNHPIFCVEGPDAVGKTTLCREFQSRHNARYMHMTLRKEMHKYQLACLLHAVRLSQHQPVMIDRHWPSEHVYAGVYRGGTNLMCEGRTMIELMRMLGVTYIFVHLNSVQEMVEAHAKSSGERPEMYEPDSRIAQVARAYWNTFFGGALPTVMGLAYEYAMQGGVLAKEGGLSYNHQSGVLRSAKDFTFYALNVGLQRTQETEIAYDPYVSRRAIIKAHHDELLRHNRSRYPSLAFHPKPAD